MININPYLFPSDQAYESEHYAEMYDEKSVGYFISHDPRAYPFYLNTPECNKLVLITGNHYVYDKVKNWRLISHRIVEAELHQASMRAIPCSNIADHTIKIHIITALNDTGKPLFERIDKK